MSGFLPNWFVQDQDKVLHGYDRADVLLSDLFINGSDGVIILALQDDDLVTRYVPTTEAEVRKAVRK